MISIQAQVIKLAQFNDETGQLYFGWAGIKNNFEENCQYLGDAMVVSSVMRENILAYALESYLYMIDGDLLCLFQLRHILLCLRP